MEHNEISRRGVVAGAAAMGALAAVGTGVATSASAIPGATALMLEDPAADTPMNEFITPITVPSSPSSGDTVAKIASQ